MAQRDDGMTDRVAALNVPDVMRTCGKCGEPFGDGGGKVEVVTFDGQAPEVGAPSLCAACYEPLVAIVSEYLFREAFNG